ncbi:MAG: hypothetical protein K2Z81_14025, partial [Cyanobacteria bacterium]|nr:hypothetical protein [Cyanobacteriota bacterium]
MTFDPAYLDRTLYRRLAQNDAAYAKAIESMMAQHAARGILASGVTLREMERIAAEHLTSSFNSAATFAYSLAGHHGPDVTAPLKSFADWATTSMIAYLRQKGRNTGLDEQTIDKQVSVIITSLQSKAEQLLDDFAHGMMDDGKMKKDPLVSLTANQTNSPGAVQQFGVGEFSQTAFVQNHQSL